MGHINPELLQEFLELINMPLFCNDRKAEEFTFDYDKSTNKIGVCLDGVLLQWVSSETWARFSVQT